MIRKLFFGRRGNSSQPSAGVKSDIHKPLQENVQTEKRASGATPSSENSKDKELEQSVDATAKNLAISSGIVLPDEPDDIDFLEHAIQCTDWFEGIDEDYFDTSTI